MMLALRSSDKDGWTDATDLQVLFFRLTLDSATEFLFGDSVDSQLEGLPGTGKKQFAPRTGVDEREFAFAFDRGQWYLARASRFGDMWWMAHNREFKELCEKVHQFVDYFVQLAVQHQLKEKAVSEGKKEKYVFLQALAEDTKDPVELRNQLLNILLAGRDTTASLLGWTFRLLAQNQEVYAKLRARVLEDFGTYEHPKPISFAALKNCQYLQWVLNESLRMYPVVPLNGRQAVRDTSLPVGGGPDGKSPVFIPKGREVMYAVSFTPFLTHPHHSMALLCL
jgi:cytochrome P450